MEVVWSRLAKETLAELVEFVEFHFNIAIAQRVANSIIEHTALLGTFPQMGYIDGQLSTAGMEVRLINCKKSTIYYAIENKTVIIVAIFDNRRNPSIIKELVQTFLDVM